MTAVTQKSPAVSAMKFEEIPRSDREMFDPTLEFQGKEVQRSDTPETALPDFPHRPGPDISIRCDKCGTFIDLRLLKEHRLYHQALATLKYTRDQLPKNADFLLKRRNAVLRKLKAAATNENPVSPEDISRINDAYEYLKSDLNGTYEELRQVHEDVDADVGGVALNCLADCVTAVGIAASENSRWKSYMEDARVFQDCFGEDKNKCFVGLYDGHHGRFAAEVAASELHHLLLNEMAKFDPRTKSTLAANMAGQNDISQYQFERPNTTQSERVILYDESVGIIQNIISICEEKYDDLIKKRDDTPEEQTDRSAVAELQGKKKKKYKDPFAKKMENAFKKVYYLLDILLSYGKDEHSRVRWSGCSSVTMVIQAVRDRSPRTLEDRNGDVMEKVEEKDEEVGAEEEDNVSSRSSPAAPIEVGYIHLANAGNTRAVLVRGNRAYGLTKDHTPNNPKERNRVLRAGATLSDSSKECRVNGVITTTRGLGNHGDQKLKKSILVEPYTTCIPVDQYAQFLILATHGVWEVFSEQEAASLLLKLLPSNYIPAPSKISSTLRPLLEEIHQDQADCQSSRRVSFSSTGSQGVKMERQKSALQSVKEETFKDHEPESPRIDVKDRQSTPDSRKEQIPSRELHHSTPTNSSKNGSGRKHKNLLDVDMTTEVGSRQGDMDSDDDSGNDADVDTYGDNTTFPGSFSRISMNDGTPSIDHLRREHAKAMAEHLVQAALLAGARDNVTVMVVLLPGCGL